MARWNHVASARARKEGKAAFHCYTCDADIEVGQAYVWCQPSRYSPRYNWHAQCAPPPGSALESNEKRAAAMAAFEAAYGSLDSIENNAADYTDAEEVLDDMRDICSALADGLGEAADLWRESASNIEDGFGHPTMVSEEMEEHADEVESVQSEVEQAAETVTGYAEDDDNTLADWIPEAVDELRQLLGDAEGSLP